jgi:beta-lactamase class A
MRARWFPAGAALTLCAALAAAGGPLRLGDLQAELERLANTADGRLGACVRSGAETVCVNGEQRFPLQSVMKLFVAVAVMDGVDRHTIRLEDEVVVRPADRSVCVQPLMDHVTPGGYRTDVGDLMRRAIVDSDCAAADLLLARLGGPDRVQAVLMRKGLSGLRIDRDERHLQTESTGLAWRPEFVDPAALQQAWARVAEEERDRAYLAYQSDPRDTATPRGMVDLLTSLAEGRLLSSASTRHLLDVLQATATFPDRLQAGVPKGWTLGHKTGTSGTLKGVTAATNDVGILSPPDGGSIAVAAFVAGSRASAAARSGLIAAVARAAAAAYRASSAGGAG